MAKATKQIQQEASSNIIEHPYDLPKSITISFDPASKFLTLQFNYIADEPTKKLKVAANTICQAGRNSQRIFALGVPTSDLGASEHVTHSLLETLRKGINIIQESTPHSQIPFVNYQILRHLVVECSPSIINFLNRAESQALLNA
jgi:hypothetical protein